MRIPRVDLEFERARRAGSLEHGRSALDSKSTQHEEFQSRGIGMTDRSPVAAGPESPLRLGLFGASLDTGNLGVSALGLGSIGGFLRTGREFSFTVFGWRPGRSRARYEGADWATEVEILGCYASRRYYSPSNLQQCRLAAKLGLARIHPTLSRILDLDAILDVSGGDSFCDLYGDARFRSTSYPKILALELGIPLVLLPQTLGPFYKPEHQTVARDILLRSQQVWTRDPRSLDFLREFLGADFDPSRHRVCVDVGFGLTPKEPRDPSLRDRVAAFRSSTPLLLGVNVSGLLYLPPDQSRPQFGFLDSYREIAIETLRSLLSNTEAKILLVSHERPAHDPGRSDAAACEDLRSQLSAEQAERVLPVPHVDDAGEVKWVIGQCDWFTGARMHACIAALSQGIPTATVAYSDKARGVAETAGAGEWALDPRTQPLEDLVAQTLASVRQREAMAASIDASLETLRRTLGGQFEEIVTGILQSRRKPGS